MQPGLASGGRVEEMSQCMVFILHPMQKIDCLNLQSFRDSTTMCELVIHKINIELLNNTEAHRVVQSFSYTLLPSEHILL